MRPGVRWHDRRNGSFSGSVSAIAEKLWIGSRFKVGHFELIPAYLNLARIQMHFKLGDSANAALDRSRAITETQLGPEHRFMVVVILESSAFVSRKTGRRSEAKDQSRRAKAIAASLPLATRVGETLIHVSDLRR